MSSPINKAIQGRSAFAPKRFVFISVSIIHDEAGSVSAIAVLIGQEVARFYPADVVGGGHLHLDPAVAGLRR